MTDPGIVFLMYHELELPGRALCQSEPGYLRYVLREDSFRAQMQWLQKNGWRGSSVGEALQNPAAKAVAITFDDGCETDLLSAAPILKENGFNATFYVTAGFIGKPGYLSPQQPRELSNLGFEIGCHSMTHAYLNDLDEAALLLEIVEAGQRIEQMIGRKVEHFSCPGGRYSERARKIARETGYKSLATSRACLNLPSTDPFLLGRVAVLRGLNEAAFAAICDGSALAKIRRNHFLRGAARKLLGNTLYDRFRARMLQKL